MSVQPQAVLCLQPHLHRLVPTMDIPITVPIVQPPGPMPSSYVKMQVDILRSLLQRPKMILLKIIWGLINISGWGPRMKAQKEHGRG